MGRVPVLIPLWAPCPQNVWSGYPAQDGNKKKVGGVPDPLWRSSGPDIRPDCSSPDDKKFLALNQKIIVSTVVLDTTTLANRRRWAEFRIRFGGRPVQTSAQIVRPRRTKVSGSNLGNYCLKRCTGYDGIGR